MQQGLHVLLKMPTDLRKSGKIAAFIGIENGYPIGKDISRYKEVL